MTPHVKKVITMSEEEMYRSLYEGYEEGTPEVELGRRFERQIIINWLRGLDFADRVEYRLSQVIAGWIERGEHLGGDDE